MGHAIGDPDPAFCAEIVAGHYEQPQLFGFVREGGRVLFERFDEQVERAVRVHGGVTEVGERAVKEIAVALVRRDIGRGVHAAGDYLLEEAGRADISERASRSAHGGVHARGVVEPRGKRDITYALAGQRERLGPAVADHGVVVKTGEEGHFRPAVDYLAVGFVRDEHDGMPELFFFGAEDGAHLLEQLAGIDRPRGVVGRIHDDALDARGERFFKSRKVGEHGRLVVGHDHGRSSRRRHEDGVFGEVGREQQELVAGLCERVQGHRERRRRAAGHVDEIGGDARAESPFERIRDRSAHARVALRRGVAVHRAGVFGRNYFQRRLAHAVRGGDIGIAERKVEHILRADFRRAALAEFEKFPDDAAAAAEPVHGLVVHDLTSERIFFFIL